DGQHVPVRVVHARGERPAAIDNETAIHFAPATSSERDRRCDQSIRIGVPHLMLGLGVVVAENPMMAREVAYVPGRRRATARKLGRDVNDRDELELHAPECLGLMEPKQTSLVEELLVLAKEHTGILALLGALAHKWHNRARSAHGFLVIDTREVTTRGLYQRAHSIASVP